MNFYKVRLPDSKEVLSGFTPFFIRLGKGGVMRGFIYSEFENKSDINLIPCLPSTSPQFTDAEAEKWIMENETTSAHVYSLEHCTTPEDYFKSLVKRFISKTREWDAMQGEGNSGTSKIVASKVACLECEVSPLELFDRLCEAYPSACVFLYSTERHGTWIGASPEPILEYRDNTYSSLSLAGTRWGEAEDAEWDQKNIEEQAIVTDFIVDAYKKFGLSPKTKGPFTLVAGPVMHLATEITAEGERDDLSLLRYLCPTPALSGFPRDEARPEIIIWEIPPRECYGGLVGIINEDFSYSTFANLRSGRLHPRRTGSTESSESTMSTVTYTITLRAGAGITHLSDPEKEWEETENKLRTLRKFIEKQ